MRWLLTSVKGSIIPLMRNDRSIFQRCLSYQKCPISTRSGYQLYIIQDAYNVSKRLKEEYVVMEQSLGQLSQLKSTESCPTLSHSISPTLLFARSIILILSSLYQIAILVKCEKLDEIDLLQCADGTRNASKMPNTGVALFLKALWCTLQVISLRNFNLVKSKPGLAFISNQRNL